MITMLENLNQTGLKDTNLYIIKTPENQVIIAIPKLNWSTEFYGNHSSECIFNHVLQSLHFQMFDGDCSELAKVITNLTVNYDNQINYL